MSIMPWVELVAATLLTLLGWYLGDWFSRRKGNAWVVGYLLPLALLVLIAVGRWRSGAFFWPGFSWILSGRTEFALGALSVAMMLTTLLPRLRNHRQRVMISILVVAVSVYMLLPFLMPACLSQCLSDLPMRVNYQGVCLQGTNYTSGPAAAVTALKFLGINAQEGELAILARSNFISDTAPDLLCRAIQEKYGSSGIRSEFRSFHSVAELQAIEGVVIVVVKYSPLVDHYVTVLEVKDKELKVADPLAGLTKSSYQGFDSLWRGCGIVVRKIQPEQGNPPRRKP
ncbi:MAG: cysteine peptidase family C39 domain-containing protein [Planctomycetota bacterium]